MDPAAIIRLLGLPETHPSVGALLEAFRIKRRPSVRREIETDARSKVVGTQDWLASRNMGIEFGFEDEASFLGAHPADYGQGPMLLTEVYFYSSHPEQARYLGRFPYDLHPEDDREAVRRKLSPYSDRLRSRNRDTWVFPEFDFTADYGDNAGSLSYVVAIKTVPPRKADDGVRLRCPGISDLASILGHETHEPQVRATLDRIRYERSTDFTNTDAATIDLREDWGLVLYFEKLDRSTGLALTRFTLLRERQYGSTAWPGALPGNLHFDCSWDEIVAGMGRPPDDSDERSFELFAFWRNGSVTTEILYSTMHNNIISVSLALSPG